MDSGCFLQNKAVRKVDMQRGGKLVAAPGGRILTGGLVAVLVVIEVLVLAIAWMPGFAKHFLGLEEAAFRRKLLIVRLSMSAAR